MIFALHRQADVGLIVEGLKLVLLDVAHISPHQLLVHLELFQHDGNLRAIFFLLYLHNDVLVVLDWWVIEYAEEGLWSTRLNDVHGSLVMNCERCDDFIAQL